MSARADFADHLRQEWQNIPELAGLRVLATERQLDAINVDTAVIRLKGVGKAPSAPNGYRTVRLLLTIISAHEDLDEAGDDIDAYTEAALDYLDVTVQHDDAEVVAYGDHRLAVDIPIHLLAKKEA